MVVHAYRIQVWDAEIKGQEKGWPDSGKRESYEQTTSQLDNVTTNGWAELKIFEVASRWLVNRFKKKEGN